MRRAAAPVLLLAVVLVAACGSDGASGESARTGAPATTPSTPSSTGARAAAARRGVKLTTVARFSSPVYVAQAPGDGRRLYVVEQGGRVMVVRGGRKLSTPFLDLRSRVLSGGEQGMLSIAFPPDFQRSRLFYVYFTGRDGEENIVELRAPNGDRADPGSQRLVLRMADPQPNHNGGLMLFAPDRLMYVGTGDGGSANDPHGPRGNAQNLGSLLGKILRIDPRASGGRPYTVPASNPFTRRAGARPEIYSFGLRNPWRFSFDRRTGDLAIADVGQDAWEEIDFVRRGHGRGANFGWRPFEGFARNLAEPAPGAIRPALVLSHHDGYCSITGGYVVRDPRLPSLAGRYVFGDFCDGHLQVATLRAGRRASRRRLGSLRVPSLSSFGQDNRGRVYAVSLAGPVFRLDPK